MVVLDSDYYYKRGTHPARRMCGGDRACRIVGRVREYPGGFAFRGRQWNPTRWFLGEFTGGNSSDWIPICGLL